MLDLIPEKLQVNNYLMGLINLRQQNFAKASKYYHKNSSHLQNFKWQKKQVNGLMFMPLYPKQPTIKKEKLV